VNEAIRERLKGLAATRTLREALARFEAVAANPRWAWSARRRDGTVVVLILWIDRVRYDEGKWVYDTRKPPLHMKGKPKPGKCDRLKNLVLARANCSGRFRVVWCEAKDTNAEVRQTVKWWPDEDLWMQLTHLDEQSGEFRAESVRVLIPRAL